jgi:hypothetical protein
MNKNSGWEEIGRTDGFYRKDVGRENKKSGVRRKRSFSQRFLESVDLPQSVSPFIPETVITISENMTLNVSSCKKILCYREDMIRLSLGKYELEVTGRDLSLKSCLNKSLELTGIIDSVSFDGRR